MTTPSIGTAVLQSVQTPNSVKAISGQNTDPSQVKGSHEHHQGENAFLQNVLQTLQNLGLNLSGVTGNSANNTVNPTNTSSASGQTASSVTPTGTNAQQALFSFLHDLHQALTQAGGQNAINQPPATQPTDKDGDHDKSTNTTNAVQSAYSNISNNLSNLVSSLTNNNSASGAIKTLQNDFDNVIKTLGVTNTSSASTPPTLQSFLQQLQGNLNQNNAVFSADSNIIKTQA